MKKWSSSIYLQSSCCEPFRAIKNAWLLLTWRSGAASPPVFHLRSAPSTDGAAKKRTCSNVPNAEKSFSASFQRETKTSFRRKSTICWQCSRPATQAGASSQSLMNLSSFWRRTTRRIFSRNDFKAFQRRLIFSRKSNRDCQMIFSIWIKTFWKGIFQFSSKTRSVSRKFIDLTNV